MWFLLCWNCKKLSFGLGRAPRNDVVPVWFHVVPTGAALLKVAIPYRASLHFMWFLCGSTWFLSCLTYGGLSLCLGRAPRNDVVPVWFHVVPNGAALPKAAILCKASLHFMWFRRHSVWFLPCYTESVRGGGSTDLDTMETAFREQCRECCSHINTNHNVEGVHQKVFGEGAGIDR